MTEIKWHFKTTSDMVPPDPIQTLICTNEFVKVWASEADKMIYQQARDVAKKLETEWVIVDTRDILDQIQPLFLMVIDRGVRHSHEMSGRLLHTRQEFEVMTFDDETFIIEIGNTMDDLVPETVVVHVRRLWL